ncbi:MAG: hypothetical protein M3453_17815, partial [Pseudomonadota bacterium]|nr:hypothetical protein [Pseudomonadota bacterium]
SALTAEERADTVVAILIDQSGSMRGQSMLLAAAAADVVQDFVRHLGSAVEVLGFTTLSWQGGRSRRQWRSRWRPSAPGRLCDLLHIIYCSIDNQEIGTGGSVFKPMLRPDLPKENVDGEALEWAAARLHSLPKASKILLVVSDGAPVDDSTLYENDPAILDSHLKQVVGDITAKSNIKVAAIGIGFEVSRYYPNSATVKTAEDLGTAMVSLLETMIIDHRAGTSSTKS